MTDFKEMLDRAKAGKLSSRDLGLAVDVVRARRSEHGDLYTALHVVGLAGSPDRAEVVRGYLSASDDPMLARLALQILCDNWSMSPDFVSEIREFVAGVPWDEDGDVRDIAISVAGRHLLAEGGPTGLARDLVEIAEDPQEFSLVREEALRALAVALGDSTREVTSTAVRVKADSSQAVAVLDRARQRFRLH